MGKVTNILIVNDDGPKAEGVRALKRISNKVWPHANIVTLVPKEPSSGAGMSITPELLTEKMEINEIEDRYFVCRGKPADLIYYAFLKREKFVFSGEWDLVLSGINHGQNVGFDIYHSGTVGAAIVASWMFNCAAYAFSKVESNKGNTEFEDVGSYLHPFLADIDPMMNGCWNVNCPDGIPLGQKEAHVARFSRWHLEIKGAGENSSDYENDIQLLRKGYLTVSKLRIDMNSLLSSECSS